MSDHKGIFCELGLQKGELTAPEQLISLNRRQVKALRRVSAGQHVLRSKIRVGLGKIEVARDAIGKSAEPYQASSQTDLLEIAARLRTH